MERQISQLIGAVISKDHVNIALLKKCKTVDVPAVNSAVHSINASKGDTEDVGIFSDCSF